MRKEDLLNSVAMQIRFHTISGKSFPDTIDAIGGNLDKYAAQVAISFSEWINDNYWIREPFPRHGREEILWAIYGENGEPDELKTTKELYNLFIESQKQ